MKRFSWNKERKKVWNIIYYRLVTFYSVSKNETNQAYWIKKAFRIQIQVHVHTKREILSVLPLSNLLTGFSFVDSEAVYFPIDDLYSMIVLTDGGSVHENKGNI